MIFVLLLGTFITIFVSWTAGARAGRKLRRAFIPPPKPVTVTVTEDLWGESRWTARDLLR